MQTIWGKGFDGNKLNIMFRKMFGKNLVLVVTYFCSHLVQSCRNSNFDDMLI
jgi:hypothetical protein